ncbi:polysaccharide deacetylase family protein [Arcticibacter eurypsychrophilus]|uniref:polysaccharide deacetylase family protein n=1 Tax=Arcticibacter eurypsychrophilus TaxID=1434752 RepID=UPI00084D429A|nr:polysaccharide deacetylase family protein [Arcticibacter eurypsychrophilus]
MKISFLRYSAFTLPLLILLSSCFKTSKLVTTSSIDTVKEISDTKNEDKNTPAENFKNKDFIPNELGRVMVLEYHLIGSPEARWRRTPENLKKDLQLLYDHNYYPVSVHAIASGELNVPAGKTPFALTFDDSSAGQFRYLEMNGKLVIDPECAVGIVENFKKAHPDFPLTATFYVLPAVKPTLRLFAQPEYKKQKLEWLQKNGYEIGNHTWFHAQLSKLSDEEAQKHLGMFVKEMRTYLPDYEPKSLALPLGMHAKNRALEVSGEFEGTHYKHESVMLVGSATSVSPYSKRFDALAIQRVQGGEHQENPENFMNSQIKHQTRFVSDGNPETITAPEALKEELNVQLIKKYKINWIKTLPERHEKDSTSIIAKH